MESMDISSVVKNDSDEGGNGKGGIRTMPFVIANEAFEKVASFGLHANMILYLTEEYHLSNATGAKILFLWGAIANFLPTLGAFLSDSYLGRFRVISLGTVVTLLGMIVLWLTAMLPGAQPPNCSQLAGNCSKANTAQLALLLSSFAIMSIGAGGIRPCSLAFGADQFDKPDDPKTPRNLQRFFNWYYATVGVSILISVTVIIYIQTEKGWAVGFGVPVGLMFVSAVLFFVGSPLYIKVKANKSLITGLFQVIAVTFKNKHLALPPKNSDGWYHYSKGSKIASPTEKLRYLFQTDMGLFSRQMSCNTVAHLSRYRFLNKACIIRNPEKDMNPKGSAIKPWSLCTVQQVEELKALIKVLPIWSSGIILAVTISQSSFPVLQAKTMDRRIFGNFQIPAATLSAFGILSLTIWVAFYDQILPKLSKLTNRAHLLPLKQRMGIGLFLSCIAATVSALVERERRGRAIAAGFENDQNAIVDMSAFWLVPQHCLTGLAEALNAIGQIEFYYTQFPKSMSSIGVALFALGMAVGNLVGSLIVTIVDDYTKGGKNGSWVGNNLNKGHYDYYYWILAILCVANFFYYLVCSWAYGCCENQPKIWDDGDDIEEENLSVVKSKETPTLSIVSSPIIHAL